MQTLWRGLTTHCQSLQETNCQSPPWSQWSSVIMISKVCLDVIAACMWPTWSVYSNYRDVGAAIITRGFLVISGYCMYTQLLYYNNSLYTKFFVCFKRSYIICILFTIIVNLVHLLSLWMYPSDWVIKVRNIIMYYCFSKWNSKIKVWICLSGIITWVSGVSSPNMVLICLCVLLVMYFYLSSVCVCVCVCVCVYVCM